MAQTRKPVKLTPEVQSRIIQQIRLGAAWEQAAVAAGVSRTTLLRWRKSAESGDSPRFRRFFVALDKALAESETDALRRIHEPNNPHWKSAAWFLERRFPQRWARNETPEVSANDADPLHLRPILRSMSSEELIKFIQRAEAPIPHNSEGPPAAGQLPAPPAPSPHGPPASTCAFPACSTRGRKEMS